MPQPLSFFPAIRRKALRGGWLDAVQMLKLRRAAEVPARDLDDYVELDWLEWNGGDLRVTAVGQNISKQLIAEVK